MCNIACTNRCQYRHLVFVLNLIIHYAFREDTYFDVRNPKANKFAVRKIAEKESWYVDCCFKEMETFNEAEKLNKLGSGSLQKHPFKINP